MPEHEDVALHLDLRDAGGRKAVGHGHHTHARETGVHGRVETGNVGGGHRLDFEVTGTVNHLVSSVGEAGVSFCKNTFHSQNK